MNCPRCGKPVATQFCTNCGTRVASAPVRTAPTPPRPAPGPGFARPGYVPPRPTPPPARPTPPRPASDYTPPRPAPTYTPARPYTPPRPAVSTTLGMNWYKFLIYFSLFASAIGGVISGFMFISGSHWPTGIHRLFEEIRMVDIIMGIAQFGLAGYSIYVRTRLAGFFQDGPKALNTLYGVNGFASALYFAAIVLVVGAEPEAADIATVFLNLIAAGVMIGINSVYFKNRAHLFVN